MDFSSSEEQQELSGLARRVLGDLVTPEVLGSHGDGGFSSEVWAALVKAGLVDAGLPAAVGGGGAGLLGQCSVLIEIGAAVAPVPYLATVTMAASAIAEFGTPEQIERWVVPVVRGRKVLAVTLPEPGTPPGFTAERSAEGWRITGVQTAVLSGAFADGFLIIADTAEGAAVFLTEGGETGVDVQAQRTIDHADAALVTLADAPGEPLGEPGSGVAEWLRLRGTTGLCAMQLGVLESALRRTAAYARERRQFDQPLAGFQAVRQRLADAYIDVEAVRLTLWQAAWRLSEGLPAAEEVATAKYWAAEAGHRVAHSAVHLHGGVGIDVDHPLHRYFAAAKRIEFALGGATAQLRALGTLLATEAA
ncbi:acyl-CoA dehydrogenase family protein [Amycolatopsis rhizosphaerae]|uniref:Acyl-CoA dehydrogenase family protein n=1 Tax=Amycolatopsis rhizosphaerae TaxID=2053003 RepID=A0A558C0B7_9PSEU|nr:acyl-CoA dehydrogenase family protein [Amycolatopsis rhizosphaerae]TVT42206.1 acyl-CoA dehydrogenase family protein [Amycolatopsis rhizosphaerae]